MSTSLLLVVFGSQFLSIVLGFCLGYVWRSRQLLYAAEQLHADAAAWQASIRRKHAQAAAERARRNLRPAFRRPLGVPHGN